MSTEQIYVPVIVTCDGAPFMSLSLANHRDVAVITVSGELDLDTVPLLIDLVERVAAAHPDRVIIDMANVTFICAAGITALLKAQDMITGAGGRLVLRAASAQTQRILAISRADHLFRPDPTAARPDIDHRPNRADHSTGGSGRAGSLRDLVRVKEPPGLSDPC